MGWHRRLQGDELALQLWFQPVSKLVCLGISLGMCNFTAWGVSANFAADNNLPHYPSLTDTSTARNQNRNQNTNQNTEQNTDQKIGQQIIARSVQMIDRTSERLYLSQSPTPPFALDGKPVYVLRRGKWLEARLQSYQWNSRVGFRYTVEYVGSRRNIEKAVPPHRIRSLSQARNSGIPTYNYNLSTPGAITEMLQAHNAWRRRYGVPPLAWSPQLATYAQEWANVLVRERLLRHRQQDKYGENLASASGKQLSATTVVRLWGEEDKYYNYSSNTCQRGQMCGHYTQLVWRTTKEVGCAMARNSQREVWVCNYNPPGNYVGQRPY